MPKPAPLNLKDVFAAALPVVLGYLPVGFAYGVLAANAGLSPLQALALSVFVYAGSSQLIAVGLIAQGIHPLSIVLTTLIVNLRHLLMSASLSPFMSGWSRAGIAAFGFELTDETFALHSLRFHKGEVSPRPAILINLVCQLAWITGSLLGVFAGDTITDVRPFALDYALPAMFIALLLLQVTHWRYVLVALAGAGISLGLWAMGLTQWNVILAALLAATLGAVLETTTKKSSESAVEAEGER